MDFMLPTFIVLYFDSDSVYLACLSALSCVTAAVLLHRPSTAVRIQFSGGWGGLQHEGFKLLHESESEND